MKPHFSRILKFSQAALLVAFAGHAARAADARPDFAHCDANRDGVVTLEEFSARGRHEQAFRAGDTNKDGILDPDEFIKAQASNDRAKAGRYFDDAWITAKVKAQLLKEARLQGLDIGVHTNQGAVRLSGTVATPAPAATAERIAAGVGGVRAVRNDLQIEGNS
ncbi:MAG: BON domain-containing protein [Pseudomonadota bacterium]